MLLLTRVEEFFLQIIQHIEFYFRLMLKKFSASYKIFINAVNKEVLLVAMASYDRTKENFV